MPAVSKTDESLDHSIHAVLHEILRTLRIMEHDIQELHLRLGLTERITTSPHSSPVLTKNRAVSTEPRLMSVPKPSASDYEASISRLRYDLESADNDSSDWSAGISRVGEDRQRETAKPSSLVFTWGTRQQESGADLDEYSLSQYSSQPSDADHDASSGLMCEEPQSSTDETSTAEEGTTVVPEHASGCDEMVLATSHLHGSNDCSTCNPTEEATSSYTDRKPGPKHRMPSIRRCCEKIKRRFSMK